MTSHLLAFLLSAATTTTVLAQENTLQVDLAGIQHDRGSIRVGLYSDPKTFRKEAQAVAIQQVAAAPGTVTVDFTALPPGRYAIMAYHDEDGNGELNRRFGMDYTAGHIFPTTGAAGALAHALRAVTKKRYLYDHGGAFLSGQFHRTVTAA